MSKISELSDGGALQSTDYLIAVRSGGNVKVQLSELPSGIGAGGNIVFGDNEKAIFGAGSDLQIYHDGSNSWVSDQGTGQLILESGGAGVYIQKGATETMANFVADGAVSLYYDNVKKIETTATGIDVTGTVTADGLTVDGDAVIASTVPRLILNETDVTNGNWDFRGSFGNLLIRSLNDDLSTASNKLGVAANGDISFYEDTGTTPKFFWDASAQRLDVQAVSAGGADSTALRLSQNNFNTGGTTLVKIGTENTTWSKGAIGFERTGDYDKGSLIFCTNDTNSSVDVTSADERMRITSAGNVGIGTSSPNTLLQLNGNSNAASYIQFTNDFIGSASSNGSYIGSDSDGDLVLLNQEAKTIKFHTSDTERMRLDSSGNLLVGRTSAAGSSAPIISEGGVTVTSAKGVSQEFVAGTTASVSTITITFDGNDSSSTAIVEILMYGYNNKYLDYVAGIYASQADQVLRNVNDGSTSVALSGTGGSSWTATISTGITNPVVKVKATVGGRASAFSTAPTITFA